MTFVFSDRSSEKKCSSPDQRRSHVVIWVEPSKVACQSQPSATEAVSPASYPLIVVCHRTRTPSTAVNLFVVPHIHLCCYSIYKRAILGHRQLSPQRGKDTGSCVVLRTRRGIRVNWVVQYVAGYCFVACLCSFICAEYK